MLERIIDAYPFFDSKESFSEIYSERWFTLNFSFIWNKFKTKNLRQLLNLALKRFYIIFEKEGHDGGYIIFAD